MNKIKKIYIENRVFVILMIIVLICFICIVVNLMILFFGTGEDRYKGRLNGIEAVVLSDSKISTLKSTIGEDESIIESNIEVRGKVVYITMSYNDTVTLEDAKTKAVQALDNFSEEEVLFYDFNFTIKQTATESTDGFRLMGSKNTSGNTFSWSNNRVVEDKEESE